MLFLTLKDVILGALRQILPQDQPLHALEIASGSYQSFNPKPAIGSLNLAPATDSVADPGFLSRIRLFSIRDPNCFHPGSAVKNLSILI
jgi:hypothetical protein